MMEAEKIKRFHSMLSELNDVQRRSVLSNDTNLQILAGPGSGKTKVLTNRVASFVTIKSIKPNNIIVVTFTNKAASEMKKQIEHLIGEKDTNDLMIGTFHSICCRLLRLHAKTVDLEPNFTVADTAMSKSIIEKIQKDPQLKISHFTRRDRKPGDIWATINKAKSRGETCVAYARRCGKGTSTEADVALIYTLYEEELKKLNLVDFDNLLIKACELLRKENRILSNVQAVLVDEYQDTNIVQYNLIKLIAMQASRRTLTIVGDPDQSIYGFRSAEPRNFIKMQREYTDTAVINMEQNYRSTGMILKAALHVISQDKSRLNKSLHTCNTEGKQILKIPTSDESAQAHFVAREILANINGSNGLLTYKDFAVLMRMNVTSQKFEEIFRFYKIPCTIVGGDRFFNRMEVKDVLGYLNFAYNSKDHMSFRRIINVPKRGIGDVTLAKILTKNEIDGTDLLTTITDITYKKNSTFNSTIRDKLLELASVCAIVKKMMNNEESVPNIIRYIVNEIRYFDHLKEHYYKDHEARWANIGELMSISRKPLLVKETNDLIEYSPDEDADYHEFTKDAPPVYVKVEYDSETNLKSNGIDPTNVTGDSMTVEDFLEYCALCSDQKELEEAEGGKVVIATLHASKGLEWPCVFIATCNEGMIPHQLSATLDEQWEECRLLYVGMTRSMFLLYCLLPKERICWGGVMEQSPSRFIQKMDKRLYNTKSHNWDDDMRTMLAETIGRSCPVAAVAVESKKRRATDMANGGLETKKTRFE